MKIAAEVIKRTTDVSPTNFDRLLRESVQEALVRAFHPEADCNEAKEAMKDILLSKSVTQKLTQTFVELEVMQTTIRQSISKRVENAITEAMD